MNNFSIKNCTTLILGNENSYNHILPSMLRELGITKTYDAFDAEMAIKQLEDQQFTVIIYDNYCATSRDDKVINFLRNNITSVNQSTPIIILSEYSGRNKVLKAASMGCDAFLIKPFSIFDLKYRLDQLLQGNRQTYYAWLKAKSEQAVEETDFVEL